MYDILTSHPDLRGLRASAKIAGLEDLLRQPGPFTLLAPVDAAFSKISAQLMDVLLASPERLARTLSFHVIPEKFSAGVLRTLEPRQSLLGKRFTVFRKGLRVNGAKVIEEDLECGNGFIHFIDTVLMPDRERHEKLARTISFQRSRLLADCMYF